MIGEDRPMANISLHPSNCNRPDEAALDLRVDIVCNGTGDADEYRAPRVRFLGRASPPRRRAQRPRTSRRASARRRRARRSSRGRSEDPDGDAKPLGSSALSRWRR